MNAFDAPVRCPTDPPPGAVTCLACKGEGENVDCDHDECQEIEGCIFSDEYCSECEGRGWIVP